VPHCHSNELDMVASASFLYQFLYFRLTYFFTYRFFVFLFITLLIHNSLSLSLPPQKTYLFHNSYPP